jgi:hypothetical protein
MNSWLQFAHTLKLRIFLRMSNVAPERAAAGIQTLQGASFLDQDAAIEYTTIGGNQNPLFSEILGLGRTQNLVASQTVVSLFKANNDPRADVFFQRYINTANNIDEIIGLPQGSYRTQTTAYSIPTAAVGAYGLSDASATAPVKFISAAESYFLQSEAVARGWMNGNAALLFEEGIRESFDAYNVPGVENYLSAAPAAQFPTEGTTQQQVQAIITQKYLAMTGNQSFEAWTEWRRTGYPSNFTTSIVSTLPAGGFPLRMLYPNTEVTRNLSLNKSPGLLDVDVPVWWDVD